MRKLSESHFLNWAKEAGIHLDDRYPQSAVLTFRGESEQDRFWSVPDRPERRPYFFLSLLDLMGDWRSCYVWRHLGSWPTSANPFRINDVVELAIFRGLQLPLGTTDVVEFSREEMDKLVTLIFATTVFGWSVGEDLYVVPDHARHLMQTDHHEVIHVSFRNSQDLSSFVTEMKEREFPLPEDVPDRTFKQPAWMTKRDG